MLLKRSIPAIIAALLITAVPLPSPAQFTVGIGFTVGSPPPPLPVYSVPPAPYPNYQWTPGYWGWGPAGYYWVPGTWVAPPSVGLYWTPGYWGYGGGGYGWNAGYWGPTVGFYGGVNYGFGYYGSGFVGGIWQGGNFAYNTAVLPVNRTVINHVYVNKTVINKNVYYNNSRVSYNGGRGGISARPTSAQLAARRGGIAPTTEQRRQATVASQNRSLYANVNHGRPPTTATARPVSDPKQMAHYAPVTSADKAAAQRQAHPTAGSSANKMSSANKAPTTATHHEAPMTGTVHHPAQPQAGRHPENAMSGQPAHHHPPTNSGAMNAAPHHPQGTGQGHPPSGAPKQQNQNGGKQKPPPA